MVTIKQIAELAGVSRGTVDRVLNGRPGVKPETEQKIRAIAEGMEYFPNTAGRIMAAGKSSSSWPSSSVTVRSLLIFRMFWPPPCLSSRRCRAAPLSRSCMSIWPLA